MNAQKTRSDQSIAHYGVKGMRWGIRRDATASRADRKWIRKTTTKKNWHRATQDYMDSTNADLAKIHESPKYKKNGKLVDFTAPENRKLHDQYVKEVYGMAAGHAKRVGDQFGLSPDGHWKVASVMGDAMNVNSMTLLVIPSRSSMAQEIEGNRQYEMIHSDEDLVEFEGFKITLAQNRFGHVESVTVDEDPSAVSHAEDLMHFGVKGMRWGQRKSSARGSSARIDKQQFNNSMRSVTKTSMHKVKNNGASVKHFLKSDGGQLSMAAVAAVGVHYGVKRALPGVLNAVASGLTKGVSGGLPVTYASRYKDVIDVASWVKDV